MIAFGDISKTGRALLLGLCDGDADLAECVRAAMAGECSMRKSAAEAGVNFMTFNRRVRHIRERLRVLIDDKVVNPADLVEQDEAA